MLYRVAAIFPEHFQSLTVALKNHIFLWFFRAIPYQLFVELYKKLKDTFLQKWINRKLQEQGQSPGFAPDVWLWDYEQMKTSRTTVEKMLSKDGPDSLKSTFHLLARRRPCPQYQEDTGLAPEEPHGGVGEGDLASQLPWLKPLDHFAWGVFELRVRAKPQNKTNDLILKIKGVMVSLARTIVVNTCNRFRSQFEAVVAV